MSILDEIEQRLANEEGCTDEQVSLTFIHHARADLPWLLARVRELEDQKADIIKRLEAIEAIEPVNGDVVGAFYAVQRGITAAIVAALAEGKPSV